MDARSFLPVTSHRLHREEGCGGFGGHGGKGEGGCYGGWEGLFLLLFQLLPIGDRLLSHGVCGSSRRMLQDLFFFPSILLRMCDHHRKEFLIFQARCQQTISRHLLVFELLSYLFFLKDLLLSYVTSLAFAIEVEVV